MNELTGQFPADWELLRLPEVLFFQEGPGITSDKFTKEGIPFINIRCFVNGRIDRSSCQFISQKLGNGEYKHFQLDVNDWVFSSSGTIGKIALIFDEDLPLLLNTSTIRFRTQDEKRLANNYIKFFLESFHFKIQHQLQTQGSAQVNVGPTHLQKMHIPLPPIKEQTQIATILSTIDRAIEQTEALITKQQRIKTGLMQDLLTKGIDENGNIRSEETHEFKDSPLGRIPVEWEVKKIEQKLERIIDYRGQTPKKVTEGIPLLTAKNVRDGFIEKEPQEFIADSAYNSWMSRGIPEVGDVLFTTEAPMGNVASIPNYRIALAQRLLTLCPKINELSQDFLFWILHWKRSKERIELLTSGSTVVGIKQSVFRKVIFAFPSYNEQERIYAVLNSHDEINKNEKHKLKKLQRLKTGLMQDLLTGKVRVTDLLNQKTAAN
ncbi:restriction endonuclease subunit S [Microcystis aeruginosa]|uniref:restriction endonuclease subunit S n=1 Tax=Microcystis aeruginosa TaxID=1126 RepID=UPI00123179E6|nr:restriction endonuclease subunit S [Microcystis aeruginosa]GCA90716.1 type-1 restriction enzyme EcoKI specificity protein [Microcystis aeruginosa NIES-4264]